MNLPNRSGYQVYQKNMYETASPHKLILMLYNGAVTNIQRAEKAIQEKNYEEASRYNLKAQDIIYELIACLNEDARRNPCAKLKANLFLLCESACTG